MGRRQQTDGNLALKQKKVIVIEAIQKPETQKLRVAAYCRVSSDSSDQMNSFAAQLNKGMGDIICCLDESISTKGDPAAWGKAVALTLLEIAADSKRKFALIHFAGSGAFKADLFRPGKYTMQDKLSAAETFLNGGTDFQTPMEEALRLMKEDGFENADIVFITDGECELLQEYLKELKEEQTVHRFNVTGVLLDKGNPDMDFILKAFCQNIYRTSELPGDDIVRELVSKRV